jgi:cystathionine beta-lyase/cystathionine gamma-synthase
VVYAETVCNPTLRVADIAAIAQLSSERGTAFVVDNTIATPYLLRALSIPGMAA